MGTMPDLRRSRAVLALSLLFLVAVPGVSAPAQAQTAGGATPGAPPSTTRSFGIYPVTPKSANTSALSRPALKASCTLTYYGGPVVSNIQVVPVYWSSNVNAQVRATMALFYADAVVSNWYDTLSEFATTSGTAQSIGRGTLSPATPSGVTLTPSRCAGAANCTVTDAQLQTEIAAQITAGVLPPAQFDSAGNPNTAYMVHFPANVTVIEPNGSSQSCVQFCAYHGTGTMNAKPLLYGVIMDYYTSACVGGCGAGTAINNTTAVASHQISEIATDADVGLFTGAVIAAPIAWYAPQANCGENADICNAQQATTTVGANTWTVQKLWSQKTLSCIASGVQPTFATNIPASASKNAPISFALTAKNPSGSLGTDIAFVGTVHFTSNDPSATLPADFTFTPANAGVANLSATLRTVGLKSITATDTRNSAITVTANVNVTVSSNADLSTLTLSAGLLNPPFASGTLSYSSGVASVVNTIAVTPTAADSGATIKVNNVTVGSGSASAPITLSIGSNPISVQVTAADAVTIKTYTINLNYLLPSSCTYALVPLDLSNLAKTASTPAVSVLTPAGCPVTATSFQPWVTIGTIVPSGNTTTVNLNVLANPGAARATTLVMGQQLYAVTQVAGP